MRNNIHIISSVVNIVYWESDKMISGIGVSQETSLSSSTLRGSSQGQVEGDRALKRNRGRRALSADGIDVTWYLLKYFCPQAEHSVWINNIRLENTRKRQIK
jgi:hypothetical protein